MADNTQDMSATVNASDLMVKRDSAMDIASLIKSVKKEEPVQEVPTQVNAPVEPVHVNDPVEPVHKSPLQQMKEAQANRPLGMVVNTADLNHDEKTQLKNKTADDAISDADKYLADMDAQIAVAKQISLPKPANPQQMVGIMDAIDRAAKNPDLLKTGEISPEEMKQENAENQVDPEAADENVPSVSETSGTPQPAPHTPEETKEMEDQKKEELKKQVIEVLIDKTGMGADFHFSDDEKAKLTVADEIHVKEVEDIDLATITVKKPDKSFVDMASEYQLSSSRVPVVFPASRFRAYMTGLTYGEMADIALTYENDNFDKANKRLSIIYNKMANPSCGKFDSYDDFLKKFSYMDINLAIYGLIIATFPEVDDIGMTCNNPNCKQSFSHKFSPRSLIRFDKCDQKMLDAMQEVINCKPGHEKELMENSPTLKHKRVRMPGSGMILEVGFASAYEYLYKIMDPIGDGKFTDEHPDDITGILQSNIIMLGAIRAIYIPNPDGSYTCYDDTEDMINILYSIKPDEIRLIATILDKYASGYNPVFALTDVRCPHCGSLTKEVEIKDISELVFRRYQRLMNTNVDSSSISVL